MMAEPKLGTPSSVCEDCGHERRFHESTACEYHKDIDQPVCDCNGYAPPPLTLGAAAEHVTAAIDATPTGSGFEGMVLMCSNVGLDGEEAFQTISGISGGVPSPLTKEQHEGLLTGLSIALIAGYVAGRGGT